MLDSKQCLEIYLVFLLPLFAFMSHSTASRRRCFLRWRMKHTRVLCSVNISRTEAGTGQCCYNPVPVWTSFRNTYSGVPGGVEKHSIFKDLYRVLWNFIEVTWTKSVRHWCVDCQTEIPYIRRCDVDIIKLMGYVRSNIYSNWISLVVFSFAILKLHIMMQSLVSVLLSVA